MNLPDLSSPYLLTDEQIAQYQRDGFIILEGVLSPDEIEAYATGIRRDAMKLFEESGAEAVFSGALLQKLNMRFESEAVRGYVLSKRVGSIGGQLTGAKAMRIYHEQVLFKPPGGASSFWHQDQYFWPIETDQALGTWMPLMDVSEDMGALRYVRGSHRLGDLGQHSINQESEDFFNGVVKENGLDVHQVKAMKAGDMCVHNGWTIHGAPGNGSTIMREAIVATMYPDGTRVGPLLNDFRKSDRVQFLGSKEVGEVADSDLNTVIYSNAHFGTSSN